MDCQCNMKKPGCFTFHCTQALKEKEKKNKENGYKPSILAKLKISPA